MERRRMGADAQPVPDHALAVETSSGLPIGRGRLPASVPTSPIIPNRSTPGVSVTPPNPSSPDAMASPEKAPFSNFDNVLCDIVAAEGSTLTGNIRGGGEWSRMFRILATLKPADTAAVRVPKKLILHPPHPPESPLRARQALPGTQLPGTQQSVVGLPAEG
jgi:hypothetical protein